MYACLIIINTYYINDDNIHMWRGETITVVECGNTSVIGVCLWSCAVWGVEGHSLASSEVIHRFPAAVY